MSAPSGLEFSFEEFRAEIGVMISLAESLLTPDSVRALKRFEQTVRQLGEQQTDRPYSLELQGLDGAGGVRTRPSAGEYEKRERKGKVVSAELRSVWMVKPVATKRKKQPRSRFRLTGLASTSISIHDNCGEILARWQMDVADERSPGCYFHIQVAQESDEPPFPAWLPVPRFPSLLVTPMAALDFVLGELFQDRWLKRTSAGDSAAQRWRSMQKKRWQHLLQWYLECVRDTGETCSPWLSIKRAQPPVELFSRRS